MRKSSFKQPSENTHTHSSNRISVTKINPHSSAKKINPRNSDEDAEISVNESQNHLLDHRRDGFSNEEHSSSIIEGNFFKSGDEAAQNEPESVENSLLKSPVLDAVSKDNWDLDIESTNSKHRKREKGLLRKSLKKVNFLIKKTGSNVDSERQELNAAPLTDSFVNRQPTRKNSLKASANAIYPKDQISHYFKDVAVSMNSLADLSKVENRLADQPDTQFMGRKDKKQGTLFEKQSGKSFRLKTSPVCIEEVNEEAFKQAKCLIKLEGKFNLWWDMSIASIIVYFCLVAPLQISFWRERSIVWHILDVLLRLVFIAEVVLNFFRPYYQEDNLICNHKKIIFRQLTTLKFWIDVITIFPYDYIFNFHNAEKYGPWFPLIHLLILYKLRFIFQLYQKVKSQKSQNRVVKKFFKAFDTEYLAPKMLIIMVFTWLISHMVACVWHFLALAEDDGSSWLTNSGYRDESLLDQYTTSLYFVFQTVSVLIFIFEDICKCCMED